MGLDMSLEGRQYISEYTDKELKEKIDISIYYSSSW